MLTKLRSQVFVAAVIAEPAQPASRTCPVTPAKPPASTGNGLSGWYLLWTQKGPSGTAPASGMTQVASQAAGQALARQLGLVNYQVAKF